ncbi:MAG: efflux RND transporter periplasmic adaptor subunit [Sphingobacterium sp.]|jgi:cobalt-zinc-cadmium efflux system membrane fusion protein|nr:efflux RND transporter periplasmic adaptor subunit [Sphingobacterium sp.]
MKSIKGKTMKVNSKDIRLKKKKLLFFIGISFFVLSSCSGTSKKEEEDNRAYRIEGDAVLLTAESPIHSKLGFETVAEEDFILEMTSAGTVKTIPNAYAEIASPFAGRVLRSFVRLGQKVQPGSPIFELSSPDYFNAEKEYTDARQEFRQAELNLKRQQDLLKNGVGIQRELEDAETDYEIKKSALSNSLSALKIFNVNPEKMSLGKPMIVRSPIKGEIVDNNIVIGQYLKEDAEPIAVVAELSKVWIVGQVKEKDIRFIHELDEVEVKVAAYPDHLIKGKVYHVNEIVDEETRSVEVLIECDNINHELKPGMYVTVLFRDTPQKSILVPSSAVFQANDKQFVFVKEGESKFVKRQVHISGTSNERVVVASGLDAGETIVTSGGSLMLRSY